MPRSSPSSQPMRPITLALTTLLLVSACASTAPRPAPATPAPSTAPAPATPAPTTASAPTSPAADATVPATASGPSAAATPSPADILATVPAISAADLEPRLATASAPLVLDVRTPEEYAQGHLPGARLIPHDQLATRLAELAAARDQDQEVIVYCRTGRRAALAIDTLKRAGFSRLGHLQGGYQGWSAEQRPVVATASAPTDAANDEAP